MQKANFNIKLPKKEKSATYKWQQDCLDMAKEYGLSNPGILFSAWRKGGYPLLDRIKSQLSDYTGDNLVGFIGSIISGWNK